MAISWGGYESSGGNGIRVGIEVNTSNVDHGDRTCSFAVAYYTQNIHTWSDSQSLNLGGSIGGSIGYSNNQGEGVTHRGTRSYIYDYANNEYGATGKSRTFSATVNGAYNGVTPSKSVTVGIPGRPIAGPAAPTGASLDRINDEANLVTWNNRETAGEPYGSILVQRSVNGANFATVANLGGGSTKYSDSGAIPNRYWQYRVRAENSANESGFDTTNFLWTTPGTPTACARADSGANQVITWSNNVSYPQHQHQIVVSVNGAAYAHLDYVGSNVATYTHGPSSPGGAPLPANKYRYKVRAVTTLGPALWSSYSGETSETGGTTTPPNAPTDLAPFDGVTKDPTQPIVLSWTHNPTDGSKQTNWKVQYRIDEGSWVTVNPNPSAGAESMHTLPPSLYGYSQTIEWQVATAGANPTFSAWSAIATFTTQSAIAVKYPVYLDLTSGRLEADSSGGGGIPGALESWSYTQTSTIALTATNALLPGVLATVTAGSTDEAFLIIATFDFQCGVSQSTFTGGLLVDGVTPAGLTQQGIHTGQDGDRATVMQSYRVTSLSEGTHTFALQARLASGSTGNSTSHSGMRVVRLVGAVGPPGPPGSMGGTAGGDLAGTYPDPTIKNGAVVNAKLGSGAVDSAKIASNAIYQAHITNGEVTMAKLAADTKDAAGGTASLRKLGVGATDAAAGNDARLSDARTPTTHTHTKSQVTDFAHAHLIADLPVAPSGTSNTTQVVRADDSRLSNSRAPTAHSHVEADLPSTLATDTEVATAVSNHAAAADPHTGYQKESEKAAANGYASLDGSTKVPFAQIPSGATSTTVSVGDHTHVGLAPALAIKDEGTTITGSPSGMNFLGVGVTVTGTTEPQITIPGIPIGGIVMWPTATAPTGWLLCNGQVTTGYPLLAAVVGANVPDYRGVFPIGAGQQAGTGLVNKTLLALGGDNKITSAHLPVHTHDGGTLTTVAVGNHSHAMATGTTSGTANAAMRAAGSGGGDITTRIDGAHGGLSLTGNTGDGGFANGEFLPPNRAINFIIRAA